MKIYDHNSQVLYRVTFDRDQLPSSMIEPRNVCKHILTIDEDGIRDAQTSSGFVSTTTSCLTIINQGCAFFPQTTFDNISSALQPTLSRSTGARFLFSVSSAGGIKKCALFTKVRCK